MGVEAAFYSLGGSPRKPAVAHTRRRASSFHIHGGKHMEDVETIHLLMGAALGLGIYAYHKSSKKEAFELVGAIASIIIGYMVIEFIMHNLGGE